MYPIYPPSFTLLYICILYNKNFFFLIHFLQFPYVQITFICGYQDITIKLKFFSTSRTKFFVNFYKKFIFAF
ncbi:hypothetical protein DN390_30480 [Bacillus sp. SH7-1]|nr:hypothetical protein DN390_30480 [Bacillus sp. SH7-1]